jgi:predicted ATPase
MAATDLRLYGQARRCDDLVVSRRVSSPEFVGRGPELAAMLGALERAAGGEFAAVFVAGESGVGKSRLLREPARTAEGSGARVLAGDCVSYSGGELPYAPVRSALRGLMRELDPEALDELLGGRRDELARLVPELGAPGSLALAEWATDEPVAQTGLFETVVRVLARLGEDAPLVLAIEDIHWADRSTLDFLSFLITDAHRQRLLLVCSYRTDALHRDHRLRSFLAQHASRSVIERVDLRAFTQEELAAQLHGILGTAPDPALVSSCTSAPRETRSSRKSCWRLPLTPTSFPPACAMPCCCASRYCRSRCSTCCA